MLHEVNDAAKIITTQEMLLETAITATESDSRSDANYYDEKSTLTNSSRLSTHSITIAYSSDKAKKKRRLCCLSNKQKVIKNQPRTNDVMV